MGQVRQIAEQRIDDPGLDAAEVSLALGLSRASLYRRLRDAGAPTPARIIRGVRLRQGMTLLLDGGHTVSQVAAAVGFVSLSQFSRTFKQAYGVAPSTLRRNAELRDEYANFEHGEPR